jgi:hypothetical protein
MNKQQLRNFHHEKGMSTLVIVLLLLFVATLVTLYTANTTVREQQVSANQYRADQALSAANAGLDYATAYYFKYTGPDAVNLADGDFSGDGFIDVLTVPTLIGDGQEVFADVWITDAGTTDTTDRFRHLVADAAFDGPHTITAVGFSDDRSATRTIEVQVDAFGIIPGGGLPGFPLIAKGDAITGGNFAIINRFSNATIWTGADTDAFGSADTFVRGVERVNDEWVDVALADHAAYVDINYVRGVPTSVLNASYQQAGLNSDVISSDDNLRNIFPDEFFENFMVEDKPTLEAIAKANGQWFSSDADGFSWETLVGLRGVIWVDVPNDNKGDIGTWAPSGGELANRIGTERYPITLIVNGNFYPAGSNPGAAARIVGLLYVIHDMGAGANFGIQGSVIVEGDVTGLGTPILVYDDALYDGSMGVPPGAIMAVVPGTWKDW